MNMAKDALKNQHRSTRQCKCGRGTVYTDNRPGTKRIDGELACEECVLDSIFAQFRKDRK